MKRMVTCVASVVCLAFAAPLAADEALRPTQLRLSKALTSNMGSATANALSIAMTARPDPARLTHNALFISSLGGGQMPRGWLSIHGKGYDGSARGHAVTISFGTDVKLGPKARGGLAVSTATASLGFRGEEVSTSARSAAFGPYLTRKLGEAANLSAWALMGLPTYRLNGRRVAGLRWNGAFALSGHKEADRAHLRGRLKLTGWGEVDRGALSASAFALSAAAEGRATFRPEKPLKPYFGVTSDVALRSDSTSKLTRRTSTRLKAGMQYTRERTRIGLDIATGPIEDDRRTAVLKVNYGWSF